MEGLQNLELCVGSVGLGWRKWVTVCGTPTSIATTSPSVMTDFFTGWREAGPQRGTDYAFLQSSSLTSLWMFMRQQQEGVTMG